MKKIILTLGLASSASCLLVSFYFLSNSRLMEFSLFLCLFVLTLMLIMLFLENNKYEIDLEVRRKIKSLIPPALIPFLSHFLNKKNQTRFLFDGDDSYFKITLEKASCYGEYGMGSSTLEAMRYKSLTILSVETDYKWFSMIFKKKKYENHILKYINLGDVVEWGCPKSYSHRLDFKRYFNFIWDQSLKPDLVLIDGRFRVACFLTSLKYCSEGTTILFDDYSDRAHYHVIEEIISPDHFHGRQAIFLIKSKDQYDLSLIDDLITKFQYVME